MKNYLMINGQQIEIPEAEIERLKKAFNPVQSSDQNACDALNEMITEEWPYFKEILKKEYGKDYKFNVLEKDIIQIKMPECNDEWSKGVFKAIIKFLSKNRTWCLYFKESRNSTINIKNYPR